MTLFKKMYNKFFIREENQDRDCLNEGVKIPIEAQFLFDKGFDLYPHKNTPKALSYFLEGLRYIPKAPYRDNSRQLEIDLSDIGNAFWAAWVCMEILEKPKEEVQDFLDEFGEKSPVTLKRIREEAEGSANDQRKFRI